MNATTPATPNVRTPPVAAAPTRETPRDRDAEYLALRALADQVLRLNRELHRERSYATTRYVG